MRRQLILLGLAVYRRYLTRFTPACPERVRYGRESCSAYAVRMVREHGAHRGLELAVIRIENCGRPPK